MSDYDRARLGMNAPLSVTDSDPLGIKADVVKSRELYAEKITKENIQGIKHDQHKPDLSLIPDGAMEGIALAMMDGEKKYSRYNYKNGLAWSKLIAAAMRHLRAFNRGEDFAEDSKLNHLYHAGATICMLIDSYENKLGEDNRYKGKAS